ncbi:MAG TPA: hypothetical protein VGI74_15715 [Streptosporangiaceae bacterium]
MAVDQLVESDGCPKDQAGELVGAPELVSALASLGMAHVRPPSPADPAWLRPASPDIALQGVLVGHQNRHAKDQELLLDGHRRLAAAQAQFGAGMNGRFPEHLVAIALEPAAVQDRKGRHRRHLLGTPSPSSVPTQRPLPRS